MQCCFKGSCWGVQISQSRNLTSGELDRGARSKASQERSGRVKAKPWELLQAAGQGQTGSAQGEALGTGSVRGKSWMEHWVVPQCSESPSRAAPAAVQGTLPVGMGISMGMGPWEGFGTSMSRR